MTRTEMEDLRDRRAYPRIKTERKFMIKVGLDGDAYGFGTVHNISIEGLFLNTDALDDLDHGRVQRRVGEEVILVGAERFNRHFSISGRIVRVDLQKNLGITITSTTDDHFLLEWAGA